MAPRALALAALLLAACGEPILYAQIDEPSVAFTQSLPALPGSPAVDLPATVLPEGGLDLPLGNLDLGAEGEHSRATLNGAVLELVTPAPDTSFAGVRRAELQLLPGGGAAPVTVASFDRERDGAAGRRLALRPGEPVNLLPFLRADQVKVQVVVAGIPPGPAGTEWRSDLTVDLHLLARVEVH